MKPQSRWLTNALALAGSLAAADPLGAETTLATFDNFTADALYSSWAQPSATIVSGATAYSVTATGAGSGYKYIGPLSAPGATTLELTITLIGPLEADGQLGPIVSLVDADGTYVSYAWPGQTLGQHVLTLPVAAPSWIVAAGSIPGLDQTNLLHLQLQLDPGDFGAAGAYTVAWENLRLTGAPIAITHYDYAPATKAFTLTWQSQAGKFYTVLHAATANGNFTTLATNVPSGGIATTATLTMPAGNSGFLRIRQQP
jgi:hypothetical protein